MIQKINANFNIKNIQNRISVKNNNTEEQTPKASEPQDLAKPSSALLQSYFVSFGAAQKTAVNKEAVIMKLTEFTF